MSENAYFFRALSLLRVPRPPRLPAWIERKHLSRNTVSVPYNCSEHAPSSPFSCRNVVELGGSFVREAKDHYFWDVVIPQLLRCERNSR